MNTFPAAGAARLATSRGFPFCLLLAALGFMALAASSTDAARAAEKVVPVIPGHPTAPLPEQRAPVPKRPEPLDGYSYNKDIGGPVKRLPNGRYKLRLKDGSTVETHGPDKAPKHASDHDGHNHDKPQTLAVPGSDYGLPPEGVQPLCPASAAVGTMGVVYAHVPYRNYYSQSASYVASAYRRAHNGFSWNGPWSGSGGNFLKWNVHCGGVGMLQVPQSGTDERGRPTCNFNGIVNAARAVYGAWQSKYVVFADCHNPGFGGQGNIWDDSRPGSVNRHNQPTAADGPMYAVIYRDYWGAQTVLHEIGHTLGAVQGGAPGANGLGHCNDGIDIMCYPEGGQLYVEHHCPDASLPLVSGYKVPPFDCGKNTYLNALPGTGGWLSTRWNIARSYNRFVMGGPAY